MAGVEEHFCDVELLIENFNCWNNEVHGKSLEMKNLCVHPRALDGVEEHVQVTILNSSRASRVDLTFFHSEGTILYQKEISHRKWKEDIIFIGPKFTEISKKLKELHTDTLIIRCRLHGDDRSDITQTRTNIEVSDFYFEVQSKVFEDLSRRQDEHISNIFFPIDWTWAFFELLSSPKCSASGDDSVAFTLQLHDDMQEKWLIRTYLSLLTCYGKTIYSEENECVFKDKQRWTFSSLHLHDLEVKKIFTIAMKIRHVLSKKPSLSCKVFTKKNYSTSLVRPNAEESNEKLQKNAISIDPENSVTLLSKELEVLYQDQAFSDFQIRCGSTSFATHKSILSARSPVFKSMLSSGMKEAVSNSMAISDIDPFTFSRFLSFLYTGIVKELEWDSALRLYYAADKYEIFSLKQKCSSVLMDNICVSNVCEILSLGSRHQDDEITTVAQNFIADNYDAVLTSEEWKIFMEKDSYLLLKTLTTIYHSEKK